MISNAMPISDKNQCVYYPVMPINPQLAHAYVPYQYLNDLSVYKIFTWERSKAVSFFSKRLHCSNNYNRHGITDKKYVLIQGVIDANN